MNLLYTTPGNFLSLESQANIELWRRLCHNVVTMPMERLTSYLRLDPASSLAFIDAIICFVDSDIVTYFRRADEDFPLRTALELAADVQELPGSCAMWDGRKWSAIPFIVFCQAHDFWQTEGVKASHARILLDHGHPLQALQRIAQIVDTFHDRVLEDYERLGMLVRVRHGRFQVGPALHRKKMNLETEYYYPPADHRRLRAWLTVKRDNEGLRHDVEMFQELLDRNATEPEMHKFFEEHPAILMQARMGFPISHQPNFANPRDYKPDFVISPILGPYEGAVTELLELKQPKDKTIYKGLHPGFTSKVMHAVDQLRDYLRYFKDPENLQAVLRGVGYLPEKPNLAVVIGRSPKSGAEQEAFAQRQSELDVKVVNYDEIFRTQVDQTRSDAYEIRTELYRG
jgi:hypothetical protein